MTRLNLPGLALLLAFAGTAAVADDDSGSANASALTPDHSIWIVEYENDIFTGADRYYTSGVRLSRIGAIKAPPALLDRIAQRFPEFSDVENIPWSLSISHNIFTPADITAPEFPPDDRPYAAWLNLRFSTGLPRENGADRLHVGLGVVGPAALGETIQKNVHRWVDGEKPVGWERQLRNEPTLELGYDRLRRLMRTPLGDRLAFDSSAFGGIQLGNAYTHLSAGGFARIGTRLESDFGPPRITPAVSGSGYFEPEPGITSWYLYAGVEGRRVFRDLFIEGNTFGGVDGVSRKRHVGELFAGAVLTRGMFRLAYTHVWRTREFVGQLEGQSYGALSLSVWW